MLVEVLHGDLDSSTCQCKMFLFMIQLPYMRTKVLQEDLTEVYMSCHTLNAQVVKYNSG